MVWNPQIYNQFKDIRYKPFYDLTTFIKPDENMKAVDLGCGTGEQTAILADKFPGSQFLGIDLSAEMLAKSKPLENDNLHFRQRTTEDVVASGERWDLIFSNAALQWLDNHHDLFPNLIALLNPKGQFAVQMPVQNENLLNKILLALVKEKPFNNYLNGWNRASSVLSIDDYAQILFEAGLEDIEIVQKVYPIITPDVDTLYNFISGSSLIPYMGRLNNSQQELFVQAFKERIAEHFPKFPAIYAFKRLLLYGRKV